MAALTWRSLGWTGFVLLSWAATLPLPFLVLLLVGVTWSMLLYLLTL